MSFRKYVFLTHKKIFLDERNLLLKAQVTFLKLCLQVVCMALIIPILDLPFLMHSLSCACVNNFYSRQHVDANRDLKLMCFDCNTIKGDQIQSSVLCKFSIHQYYVNSTLHAVVFRFHKFIK